MPPASYIAHAPPSLILKKRIILLKRFLVNMFVLQKSSYDVSIIDESTLYLIIGFFDIRKKDFIELVKYYTKNNRAVYVYVDTPLEVGFNRLKRRTKVTEVERIYKMKGHTFNLKVYEKMQKKFKQFYMILQDLERADVVEKVIKLDGESPVLNNAKIVKEYINARTNN